MVSSLITGKIVFQRSPDGTNGSEQKAEGSLNLPKKVAPPPQMAKQEQPMVAEKPKDSIFTFPSPPSVEKPRRANDHDFLDACAFCKKKTDFKEDIFVYGDFQEFTPPGCRDDQIALDYKCNPPSPASSCL